MQYRQLGNTDMKVSVLGLGGASLGTQIYKDVNQKDGIKTVHRAFELGINFVDVSPYYGLTKAEETLGKALLELRIPRESYYIATKVGRYGGNDFNFTADRVTKSVDESLERLGLDYIDLIQCHYIEFTSLDQIVNETLPALRKLKEQGKVRHIGITGYPLKIFKYVLEKDRTVDTVLSYCHYSLNNTLLNDVIPLLKERKVGIVNAAALSMGLLTSGGPPSWHPASLELKNACIKASSHATSKGVPIEKLALQFALSNNDIHSTLIGTGSIQEIEQNVKWCEELQTSGCDMELVTEIQNILKPVMNQCWTSGKPENNDKIEGSF